jgi:hypothetical protein
MASTQGNVYGHSDCWGIPFDFYSGIAINGVTGGLVSGAVIAMQTGKLVLAPAGAISITVTLPLNPPDGADAEIQNYVGSAGTVTLSALNANTNDVLLGTTPASIAAGATVRYKYVLNGDITKGSGPRTWIRVL